MGSPHVTVFPQPSSSLGSFRPAWISEPVLGHGSSSLAGLVLQLHHSDWAATNFLKSPTHGRHMNAYSVFLPVFPDCDFLLL